MQSTQATQAINLAGKRVLLTQASDFMGPALAEVFRECGADVIAADGPITDLEYPQQLIDVSGEIDVLLLNLGVPAPTSPAAEVNDDEWRSVFNAMVDPLPRFARALLPQMLARGSGKILLIGSASALRPGSR
jgi:NAD(P)-dependent dehydrogenase (short-subunit alcohol dehydrogenase family)